MSSSINTVPARIPAGAVIGRRYRIDALLAEGGMGIVYKGFHLALQQPIAIKVVRDEFAARPEAVARFLNEARALAGLRGPHIAHVLDVGRMGNGPPYMVLEYLEGDDLRTVLELEGPLGVERATTYILEACEALAEAHARGIIHRDIKPENLFVTGPRDGTEMIKLIDFGVSKRDTPQSRTYTLDGQSLGSPHYMAPEQMSKPHEVDARADIWSLGVVLYELLTGAVPFEGNSLPEACASILCAEPRPLSTLDPSLPEALEAVVLRCLAKSPSERYADVGQLAEALSPFAAPDSMDCVRRVRRALGQHRPARAMPVPTANGARETAGAALISRGTPSDPLDVPAANDEQAPSEPEFRIPKKPVLWPVPLAIAAAGLTAWLGATRWDQVTSAAAHVKAEAGEVATLAAAKVSPSAARLMGALSTTTKAIASRVLPPARIEPAVVHSPAEAGGYASATSKGGSKIEAAALTSSVSDDKPSAAPRANEGHAAAVPR